MHQSKKCPSCAKEIKTEATICPSCGSDVSSSPSKTQVDTEPKKKWTRSALELLGLIIGAWVLAILYPNLPETGRQWVDWLFGKDKPYMPIWVVYLLLALWYVVTRRIVPLVKNSGRLKSFNKNTDISNK